MNELLAIVRLTKRELDRLMNLTRDNEQDEELYMKLKKALLEFNVTSRRL